MAIQKQKEKQAYAARMFSPAEGSLGVLHYLVLPAAVLPW
jgi:hypothetical protein